MNQCVYETRRKTWVKREKIHFTRKFECLKIFKANTARKTPRAYWLTDEAYNDILHSLPPFFNTGFILYSACTPITNHSWKTVLKHYTTLAILSTHIHDQTLQEAKKSNWRVESSPVQTLLENGASKCNYFRKTRKKDFFRTSTIETTCSPACASVTLGHIQRYRVYMCKTQTMLFRRRHIHTYIKCCP